MVYWRRHWTKDVLSAYDTLISQEGVEQTEMGVAGASCGVFLGLDFALSHPNIKSLVLLGGPSDSRQREQLGRTESLPTLIITGDEGGSLKWSDEIFASSKNTATRLLKFKIVTHGTKIFEFERFTERMVIDWFMNTLDAE